MSGPKKPRADLTEHAYRKARKEWLEHQTECVHCGLPLDFDAPPRSRWSPTVDHIIPVSLGGDPKDQTMWQPSHHGCNSARGNGATRGRGTGPMRASRRW